VTRSTDSSPTLTKGDVAGPAGAGAWWWIDDTFIAVGRRHPRPDSPWMLGVRTDARNRRPHPAQRWLAAQGLDRATFPTRQAALRAYTAATAIAGRPPSPKPIRLTANRDGWRSGCGATVQPYGNDQLRWMITLPNGRRFVAATLSYARRIIAHGGPIGTYTFHASPYAPQRAYPPIYAAA